MITILHVHTSAANTKKQRQSLPLPLHFHQQNSPTCLSRTPQSRGLRYLSPQYSFPPRKRSAPATPAVRSSPPLPSSSPPSSTHRPIRSGTPGVRMSPSALNQTQTVEMVLQSQLLALILIPVQFCKRTPTSPCTS